MKCNAIIKHQLDIFIWLYYLLASDQLTNTASIGYVFRVEDKLESDMA